MSSLQVFSAAQTGLPGPSSVKWHLVNWKKQTRDHWRRRYRTRLYGRSGSYVTSYDGWHRNSDRHLRFEEDQLGIRAIVRWLDLADNTERVP